MKIGYARILLTNEMRSNYPLSPSSSRHLQIQEDALKKSGCTEIFTDITIGVKPERPKLEKALAYLGEKDTLVVWQLDKLGRSIPHLIRTVKSLGERNISLQSLRENLDTSTEVGKLIFEVFNMMSEIANALQERDIGIQNLQSNIDTTTSVGKLVFHVFSALAEVERDLIKERTQVWFKSIQKAKETRVRRGGRPPLMSDKRIDEMLDLYESGKSKVPEICKTYEISRPNFYYYLKKRKTKLL